MNEIWRDIPEYEGMYQVSNLGNVKSIPRLVKNNQGAFYTKERILKPQKDDKGYFAVSLSKKSNVKSKKIHHLVAVCFLNHTPCGHSAIIDHKNNISTDNRLENLQIISHRHNITKDRKDKTSKYIGVSWRKENLKWRASIQYNKKPYHIGYFDLEHEAYLAYQNKLKEFQIK